MLVHHYAEHLGRWLDGTDAARRFTLSVPEQVNRCSILLHAVVCFAARHLGNNAKAEEAYEACLLLVKERLDMNTAMHDVDLLCAIVILRFFEQLGVPSESGTDREQHLAGRPQFYAHRIPQPLILLPQHSAKQLSGSMCDNAYTVPPEINRHQTLISRSNCIRNLSRYKITTHLQN